MDMIKFIHKLRSMTNGERIKYLRLTTKADPSVNGRYIKGITIPLITPYILKDL